MRSLNWKSRSFLQKSTGKPLAIAIFAIFISLIGSIVFANFYKIDRVVIATAEVISTLGEKEILAPRDGKIINWTVTVGQLVREGDVLGQIQIPEIDSKVFGQVLKSLHEAYTRLQAPEFQISDFSMQPLLELKTSNPIVMKFLIESETAWKKYQLALHESDYSAIKKLKILKSRKEKLQDKISRLNQNTQVKFLRSLSDELYDQKQLIENEENSIKEDIHQKIQAQKNQTLEVLKTAYLGVYNLNDSTLIKASNEGIVARKTAQNFQHVSKNQNLLTIIPDQVHFQLLLSIPAQNISKVKVDHDVKVAIESFPYQRFGHFQGKIESIDRTNPVDQKDLYLARSSLRPPQNDRHPATAIQLLPGMKAKVYILTDKLTILQMIYEKIFSNDLF